MRAGVWCGAAALTLLTLASALRTSQVEGASRASRRLPAPSAPEDGIENTDTDEVLTFRPRTSRRREEIARGGEQRVRSRSRPAVEVEEDTSNTGPQTPRNERFDSRRTYSRTRNRPIETEPISNPTGREYVPRSKPRQSSRERQRPQKSQAPLAISSPKIESSKPESYNPTTYKPKLTAFTVTTPRTEDSTTTQIKRRGSTTPTAESLTTRRRGRINTRVDTRALDLAVSGTTNTITVNNKEPTTARTADDLRNSRKLRYRTRLSETDTNLKGEGVTNSKVSKSSQNKENITSQPEFQTLTPVTETTAQSSTEAPPIQSTLTKPTKVERRPLTRGKENFRPAASLKKKHSDEISEDDNYPESFKALLQAKNASTQPSSPSSESLSVKASQKVYKTYTPSPQSSHNGSTKSKYARFRSKISAIDEPKMEESKTENSEGEIPKKSTVSSDSYKPRAPEFRLRSTYNPRNRKLSNFSTVAPSAAGSISSDSSSEKPSYKYNRKFKPSTTEVPKNESTNKFKRLGTATLLKKSLTRPAYNSRRNSSKNLDMSSESPISRETDNAKKESDMTYIKTLPRTSYYSRLRSKNNENVAASSSTEANTEPNLETPADKKMENSADMPLIFSLMKNYSESEIHNTTDKEESSVSTNKPEKEKKMFIIAVTSRESSENSTENEVPNKTEETEDKIFVDHLSSAQKYHANYKNKDSDGSQKKDQETNQSTPRSNSYQSTRRNGRKRTKPEYFEEMSVVTPKTRERSNQRKYSEGLTKTTEPSTNGIPPEPEKQKSRYSAKYRSSYIDKPNYKPTIPTVTPSTAWLKFFVTDPQLAKSVEEPYWFEGDDIFITTEMSRHTSTISPSSHESSLELVEGEEMQLGPDMNAISFTKTRSTLSSADLRLSESLDKPSHVMNVEASQHSPSVTVSIFDALAEILTSTPRTPRLSSTTDVTQKQNINDITLGVSNSITVNNIRGLASQDTFTTIADVNSNTNFVQTTAQTPTVINSQPVEEVVTPSLNTQDGNVNPVNTPTLPTPPPTTPVSVRRPFAIKVLYTDTESPKDKMTTTESIRTSTQPPTDIPETVLNTVSDFLLVNNHLVSSELTSMLSNNIKNIMQNMDEQTRSKISVDMAKLLKTLIPRALDGLSTGNNDVEKIQDTTPYSLEEIRDTANIYIENKTEDIEILDKNDISISESLQSVVTDNTVNSKSTSIGTTLGVTETYPTLAVNTDELLSSSAFSASSGQMMSADVTLSTAAMSTLKSSTTPTIIFNTTPTTSTATSSDFSDTESISVDGDGNRVGTDDTNTNVPFPFLTNFKVRDFTPSHTGDLDSSSPTTLVSTLSSTQAIPNIKSGIQNKNSNSKIDRKQDSSQMGPLQLWVLNKKVRVLQMIEDLLRKHNAEIQTVPPMTELLNQPNNIPLSNRLTEILNTMSSTTEATDITTKSNTLPMTTQSISSFPLFSTQSTSADSGENFENGPTTSIFTSIFGDNMMSTTTQAASDIFSRLAFTSSDTSRTQVSTVKVDTTTSTSSLTKEKEESTNISEESSTTQVSTETTTEMTNTETIQTDTELLSTSKFDVTSEANVASTTKKPVTERNQNLISVVSNKVNIPKEPPKKDYVIFGILPNNTVVRKDPNDDILETLTEASPYIVYSLLPNNTVIRRFPNGTRVPRVMQKIDVLPISPWTLRNPYSPIHNNPAIVRPYNPIRVSTNIVTSSDTSNNGTENRLTIDTVNNQQTMIPTTLNIKDSLGVTTATNKPPAEKSTASHVLSLRTSTMLPSVDEILLNSISSAVKEEMVISSMMSSTREPTILTLDIDPETGQIRTEKPGDGSERTVFKYIPINEVTAAPQGTNVLKLAANKAPSTQTMSSTETFATVTEIITQTPQIQTRQQTNDPTTTEQTTAGTSAPVEVTTVFTNSPATTEGPTSPRSTVTLTANEESTESVRTTLAPTTTSTEASTTVVSSTHSVPMVTKPLTTTQSITLTIPTTTSVEEEQKTQEELVIPATERNAKSLDVFSSKNQVSSTESTFTVPFTSIPARTQTDEETKLLQAILAANSPSPSTVSISNLGGNIRVNNGAQTSTSRSIEDDIRQFEEDTKLLKALLAATGQNPANLNIPSLESLNIPTRATSPLTPATQRITTTMRTTTTPSTTTMSTTPQVTTTFRALTTTQSVSDDLRKLTEDAKLLQALLQATGQNIDNAKPVITGVTSNVRIASDPKTTTIGSNPTTPVDVRPIFTSRTTPQPAPVFLSPVLTTLQLSTTTEESSVSTTLRPETRKRMPATTTVATARRAPSPRFTVTTEIPSTSTFSDEEDLQFLQNLKSVLNNNPNQEDPEAGLANRIIALAVERSLNEIESGKQANDGRTGKTVVTTPITKPVTTTTTTTTTTSTTTDRTTTSKDSTPSFEDDIKQFQEDTKLLQALLKATGQDPSKFNIPTLPPIVNSDTKVSAQLPTRASDDLKLLSNLLASPSPLNEPFDSLTEKPKSTIPTTLRPFGAKIVVKDNLKTEKDDENLLQTLVKLQGVRETTTQRSKLAITGQSPEEALKKLSQQTKTMMSDATKTPVSISTEYGKSNDALLAALLKEQGFGPTTASSLDEQLRLAALLNQVVVTPKARRTTTTPPPPPPPPARRPVLDGLAWLWQQWRDTDPGRPAARPNRRPSIPSSAPPSGASSNRVPWFGSGPFVGNADEPPSSNRVPLEPPRAVTSEQAPGRGQLVSAAINVTRAFSQFLGAAIAGAAQTVQSVIRAGQRATADAYTTGSG